MSDESCPCCQPCSICGAENNRSSDRLDFSEEMLEVQKQRLALYGAQIHFIGYRIDDFPEVSCYVFAPYSEELTPRGIDEHRVI